MVTKLATFVLVGSVVALAVGGLTGKTRRRFEDWDFGDQVRIRKEIRHRVRHEVRARAHRQHADQMEHVRVRVEQAAQEVERAHVEVEVDEVALNAADQLVGTYVFDANGNPFGKLPWSAHVELQLQPNGKYELRLRTNVDQELDEETSWGRYRIDGDRMTLISAHDRDEFGFKIEGDRLLFDADWPAKLSLRALGVENTFMKKVQ